MPKQIEMKMKALSGKKVTTRGRLLSIPPATMDFLMTITEPAQLDHNATHADFIRNNVLKEIRDKVIVCDQRGSY